MGKEEVSTTSGSLLEWSDAISRCSAFASKLRQQDAREKAACNLSAYHGTGPNFCSGAPFVHVFTATAILEEFMEKVGEFFLFLLSSKFYCQIIAYCSKTTSDR